MRVGQKGLDSICIEAPRRGHAQAKRGAHAAPTQFLQVLGPRGPRTYADSDTVHRPHKVTRPRARHGLDSTVSTAPLSLTRPRVDGAPPPETGRWSVHGGRWSVRGKAVSGVCGRETREKLTAVTCIPGTWPLFVVPRARRGPLRPDCHCGLLCGEVCEFVCTCIHARHGSTRRSY